MPQAERTFFCGADREKILDHAGLAAQRSRAAPLKEAHVAAPHCALLHSTQHTLVQCASGLLG